MRDFQTQQKALFNKYQDLRHDYKELNESAQKLLWEDMFPDDGDGGLAYNFISLKKRDEDLLEEDDR